MSYLHRCIAAATGFCLVSCLFGCSKGTANSGPAAPPPSLTTSPSAPVTVKAKFAYTGNQGGSLSGYAVNPSSGVLTPLSGFPLVLGGNPNAITHDPQNRFLIVADVATSQLHVLAIDSTTGALAEVSPSPYVTIKEPVSVITDPSGTHVYVVGQGDHNIGAYNLSPAGVLTSIAGAPFSTGSTSTGTFTVGSSGIVTDAAGKFLYVQDLANLYVFRFDSTSGAIAPLQTVPSSYGGGIALDPAGKYLYAAGSNLILSYGIDSVSGLLTLVKSSPTLKQNGAYTISVSSNGQFAYMIENNNDLVSYTISNGGFTPVGNTYSGVYGDQIAIDPSDNFVYVPQACTTCTSGAYNVVNEFSIGNTGALTPLSGSPVTSGVTPWGITLTTQQN
ncbi:MAG: beta-propeller fold lactonase family protein [Edaphobacter sp.]